MMNTKPLMQWPATYVSQMNKKDDGISLMLRREATYLFSKYIDNHVTNFSAAVAIFAENYDGATYQ